MAQSSQISALVNPGCQKFKLQHGIATTTNISY